MRGSRPLALAIVLLCTRGVSAESSPPVSAVNPVTGAIETVDAAWAGDNYEIRHVVNPGSGMPLQVTILTSHASNDVGPRLAVDATTGDTVVVWWREAPIRSVLSRRYSRLGGTWTPGQVQSDPALNARRPSVAFDAASAWVAYEIDSGGATFLSVQVIDDEPTPFGTAHTIGTLSQGESIDPLVLSEAGHLWVSWVNDATEVGWIEFDHATGAWTNPRYETCAEDSVPAARSRIRSTVLSD